MCNDAAARYRPVELYRSTGQVESRVKLFFLFYFWSFGFYCYEKMMKQKYKNRTRFDSFFTADYES